MFNNLTLSDVFNKEVPFDGLIPGEGIVLIGTSELGPAMVPIRAVDIDTVISIFGIDSQLTNAYMEAVSAGGSNIYLIRINGSHAVTNVQNILTLTSTNATDDSGNLQYSVTTHDDTSFLNLYNPATDYIASYRLNGRTIEQIASAINIDAITFKSPVFVSSFVKGSASLFTEEDMSDSQTDFGGTELGLRYYYYKRLEEILTYLMAYPIGQVGILCIDFDEIDIETDNYFYQLIADFASSKAKASEPCIVTIGVNTAASDFGEEHFTARCRAFTTGFAVERSVSEFICVPLGRLLYEMPSGSYNSNGVAAYCGLLSKLHYADGPTYKEVVGPTTDSLNISHEGKKELSDMGYIVFISGLFGGQRQVRVLKGTNFARSINKVANPDFITAIPEGHTNPRHLRTVPKVMSSVANVKLVQHIAFLLRELFDEEGFSLQSLRTKVDGILSSTLPYISDYSINITEFTEGFARSFRVDIEITPAGEVESAVLTMQAR